MDAATLPNSGRERSVLTRWLFLRLLGVAYFCAFASLWPQVRGLIGSHGILPAADFLTAVRAQFGAGGFWLAPSLAWVSASDQTLNLLCGAGTLLSLLLVAGVLPLPTLVLLWGLYLSLMNVGQDFLSFQWDSLLLETGFLAIFLAPGTVLPRFAGEASPSRISLWLLRWLLFRLIFLSGVVKLASGDPSWRSLTALSYHYWTQPLPTPLAYGMAHLPFWFQKFSTGVVLGVELAAPFLIFGPRRGRLLAAGLLAGLQGLIGLTGNYAFFNLLTFSLCVLLLDDAALSRLLPRRLRPRFAEPARRPDPPRGRRGVVAVAAILLFGLSLLRLSTDVGLPWGESVLAAQEPWHLVSSYGLFAVMTTSRPEVFVEGSDDGRTWRTYGFRYQSQDVTRAPRWVAPYQPRLDWQMWFAALGSPDQAPWFRTFLLRLLQGSPDVRGLLGSNPFPHTPPHYVRAVLYDYRFTTPAEHQATGAWWERRPVGLYFPPVSLRSP